MYNNIYIMSTLSLDDMFKEALENVLKTSENMPMYNVLNYLRGKYGYDSANNLVTKMGTSFDWGKQTVGEFTNPKKKETNKSVTVTKKEKKEYKDTDHIDWIIDNVELLKQITPEQRGLINKIVHKMQGELGINYGDATGLISWTLLNMDALLEKINQKDEFIKNMNKDLNVKMTIDDKESKKEHKKKKKEKTIKVKTKEEPKKEEAKQEVKLEVPKSEEVKQEVKVEEPKKEEPKKEEVKEKKKKEKKVNPKEKCVMCENKGMIKYSKQKYCMNCFNKFQNKEIKLSV